VANKDTQTVVSAQSRSKKLPSELYRSLTWGRGKELTDHRRFTLDDKSRFTSAIRKARAARVQ